MLRKVWNHTGPRIRAHRREYLLLNISFGMTLALLKTPVVKADTVDEDVRGIMYENNSLVLNTDVADGIGVTPLATTVNSGTFGTCDWDINDEGQLTIHAGTLAVGQGNWIDSQASIKSVYIEPDVVAARDSDHLFANLTKVTTIDVTNLDTSNVTDFSGMFSFKGKAYTSSAETSVLTSIIGLNELNTTKATNMGSMFNNAYKLESIDVSNFTTSHVTNFGSMFAMGINNPGSLKQIIGLEKWDTAVGETFGSMFAVNPKLTSLDVSHFTTANALSMKSMFSGLKLLTELDVSGFVTPKVTDMSSMFADNFKLTKLDMSGFDTSSVTDMSSMFINCPAELLGLQKFQTDKVTTMSNMFSGTSIANTDDIAGWDTAQVTNISGMFYKCTKLVKVDISAWKKNQITDIGNLFAYDTAITEIKGLEGEVDGKGWDTSNVTNMSHTFYGIKFESFPEIANWKTQNVINMDYLFSYCNKLTSLDLSNWDTSSVVNMEAMFDHTAMLPTDGLKGLDTFETGNVTNMKSMFTATGMDVLDLSSFNTSKVTDMNVMFSQNGTNLKKIIGVFDTSNVTKMAGMFTGTTVDDFSGFNIADWNTTKVRDFSNMFTNSEYTNLDIIKKWDTTAVTNFKSMFSGMSELQSIDLGKWKISPTDETDLMFLGNTNLWRLTLGPDSMLGEKTSLTKPVAGTAIEDAADPGHKAISDKWQEVAGDGTGETAGTYHQPVGELFGTDELLELYRAGGQPEKTFVWQQEIYRRVSLEVPDIDFGSFNAHKGIIKRVSDDNQVKINKYTYPSTTMNSTLSVSMDHPLWTEKGGSELESNLIYRDEEGNNIPLSDNPAIVYDGQIDNGTKNITWDDEHGVLLNFTDPSPQNGDYKTTLTWTLTDSAS